jgi:hypothetical protein
MRTLKIATTAVVIVGIVAPAQPAQRSADPAATEASPETPDNQPALPSSAAAPSNASTSAKTDEHPDKTYWKHAVGPTSVGRAAMGAGTNQLNNTPAEWGQGSQAFGKRFASSFGRHLVKKGIQYPVSKLFHEELSYHRSNKTGFGPRLKYALVGVVITHKTTDGKATVAKGELTGAFGSGLISRAWQPASTRTIAAGFSAGGLTLAADAAGNVIREFWPEIRHPRSHGKEGRLRDADRQRNVALKVETAPDDETTTEQPR